MSVQKNRKVKNMIGKKIGKVKNTKKIQHFQPQVIDMVNIVEGDILLLGGLTVSFVRSITQPEKAVEGFGHYEGYNHEATKSQQNTLVHYQTELKVLKLFNVNTYPENLHETLNWFRWI